MNTVPKTKVLVVEDSPEILALIALILTTANYKVILARSGIEGLRQFNQNPDIQIVLSDVLCAEGLTSYDGIALGKDLRARHKDLTIIYMSGKLGNYGWTDLTEVTPYFIGKPFKQSQLKNFLIQVQAEQEEEAAQLAQV